KRLITRIGRGRIVIREIIEHFLNANPVGWGKLALVEKTAHERVARRIDVDRKRRLLLLGHKMKSILGEPPKILWLGDDLLFLLDKAFCELVLERSGLLVPGFLR